MLQVVLRENFQSFNLSLNDHYTDRLVQFNTCYVKLVGNLGEWLGSFNKTSIFTFWGEGRGGWSKSLIWSYKHLIHILTAAFHAHFWCLFNFYHFFCFLFSAMFQKPSPHTRIYFTNTPFFLPKLWEKHPKNVFVNSQILQRILQKLIFKHRKNVRNTLWSLKTSSYESPLTWT